MNKLRSSEYVLPIIYKAFINEQRERLNELSDEHIIYVTDLVACSHKLKLRQLYPELNLRFDPGAVTGSLIHIGIEKYLKDNGFEVEVPVEKKIEVDNREYILKGRIDAYKPDEKIVVEIKSGRDIQGKPLEHHILQLQIYLNLLDADTGILFYVTPEGFLEFMVNKEKLNIKSLVKTIVRDEIHPRWSWECRYCIYKRICSYVISER